MSTLRTSQKHACQCGTLKGKLSALGVDAKGPDVRQEWLSVSVGSTKE